MEKRSIKVLVCGGRDCDPYAVCNELAHAALVEIGSIFREPLSVSAVIHGGASGADTGADFWARDEGYRVIRFPAAWKKYGKAAGPIRNQKMMSEGRPDVVIAFNGGTGTASMIRIAEEHDVPIIRLTAKPSSYKDKD